MTTKAIRGSDFIARITNDAFIPFIAHSVIGGVHFIARGAKITAHAEATSTLSRPRLRPEDYEDTTHISIFTDAKGTSLLNKTSSPT